MYRLNALISLRAIGNARRATREWLMYAFDPTSASTQFRKPLRLPGAVNVRKFPLPPADPIQN
jgi:hypothetical protein